MLKLYNKTFSNLLGTLDTVVEALVEEERNGLFELSFTMLNTDSLFSYIEKENIVVCNANDVLLNQKFRIYNTRKLMNNRVEVYARHISFDLIYDYIESLSFENRSCEYALNQLFRNSNFSTHYKGYSDIVNAQNYNISNVNLLSAIGGTKGSIIDTFGTGAEILRDNENIHVLNKRGHDNSVTIEYRKNLTGFELEEDTTDLVTRILPYAKYTLEGGEETTVKANYVDSPFIDNYSHPFIKSIDYSDKFEDKEVPTIEKLIQFAEKEYTVDIPKQNYKIEFVHLSKCVGYEALNDNISLCDTITIIDTRYNVNTQSKVIKTVFNVLKNRYESIELGEPRTSLGDIISSGSDDKVTEEEVKDIVNNTPSTNYPNTLPKVPVLESFLYGFANIELRWTFENKVYYAYEVYASKTKDFVPNVFDLIYQGQASSYMFQAQPNETWYFKVCGINSYNRRTEFSNQVEVITTKISDLSNYVSEMAIGDALIGELNLGRGWVGQLNANLLDVKGNFSVTDGNGKRTMDIDSFGNVALDVTSLKINSTDIDKTINNVFDSKTQLDIFNKLTNNSQLQGIYLEDGKLYLNGEYMKLNTLKVGDFSNLVTLEQNATFDGSNGVNTGYEICNIAGSEKYNHAMLTNKLYIESGTKFRVKANIFCNTVNSRLNITCCWRDNNGSLISTSILSSVITEVNVWQEINDVITVPNKPANASYVNFKISIQEEQSRRFYIENLSISKMIGGELVVDGLIDGKQIKGVTIVGGEIRGSSNFFTAPDVGSVDGYAFRIYSSGELHSNNFLLTSKGDNYSRLEPNGNISCSKQVNSPALVTGGQSLWLGIRGVVPGSESNFNIELTQQADKNVYLRPGYNGQTSIGHPAKMFNTVYSVNGTSSSSDRTLKENIKYLGETPNNNAEITNDITEEDLYNFVKNINEATFNFIGEERQHIGFIAQDLLYNVDGTDNKVGQIIVNNEQSPITYNEKIFTNVLAGALKQAINKIEGLEKEIKQLK